MTLSVANELDWRVGCSEGPSKSSKLSTLAIDHVSTIIIIIIIIRFIKRLRPWLQRSWRQVSRISINQKLYEKKYVLSLDLNTDSESTLIIV